jgi:hypothetical protein
MMPLLAAAQDSDLGNWILLFGNKQINQKFNWHHEIQYRNYNAVGDLEQLLLRTGIGTQVTDNTNLLLGYGFIRSENYIAIEEKVVVNEHRIFQQVITKQSIAKLRLQHRYRFEQRFVEDDFRLRFRYFLGLAYPLWNDADSPKELYLSGYNEIFLNTKSNVFDRNRLYGGLGYRLNEMFRFELGYMNQFLNSGNRDQLNLVCFVNW